MRTLRRWHRGGKVGIQVRGQSEKIDVKSSHDYGRMKEVRDEAKEEGGEGRDKGK